MYRYSYYKRILEIVKEKPRSQREIHEILGKDNISLQGVSKHLMEGTRMKEIAYFGNMYGKLYPGIFLRKGFKRKWPENAQRFYFSTPEGAKLYRKLIKKFGEENKKLIHEVTRYYQSIEVMSIFQEIYMTELMRKDINRFYRNRKKIVKIESNNEGFLKLMKLIKRNPVMHWCAYKTDKNRKNLTLPMFNKLKDLFIKNDS
jgi:hypothetical protein